MSSRPHLAGLRGYVRELMGELEPGELTDDHFERAPIVLQQVWACCDGFHRKLVKIDNMLEEVEMEMSEMRASSRNNGMDPGYAGSSVLFIIAVTFGVILII